MIALCEDGMTTLLYDDFHTTKADSWPIWEVQREYELNQQK